MNEEEPVFAGDWTRGSAGWTHNRRATVGGEGVASPGRGGARWRRKQSVGAEAWGASAWEEVREGG